VVPAIGPAPGESVKLGENVMVQLTDELRSCSVTVKPETFVAIVVAVLPVGQVASGPTVRTKVLPLWEY
jgi:hypothetical protein